MEYDVSILESKPPHKKQRTLCVFFSSLTKYIAVWLPLSQIFVFGICSNSFFLSSHLWCWRFEVCNYFFFWACTFQMPNVRVSKCNTTRYDENFSTNNWKKKQTNRQPNATCKFEITWKTCRTYVKWLKLANSQHITMQLLLKTEQLKFAQCARMCMCLNYKFKF